MNDMLSAEEYADMRGISYGAAAQERARKIGPGFIKEEDGRVYYRRSTVEAWLAKNEERLKGRQPARDSLGWRVMVARKTARMSQSEFGKIMGWSQRTVSDLEGGKRGLDLFDAYKVADALGVTVGYLAGRGAK